jgi:hypothetical protein
MINGNTALQVFGKAGGYFMGKPVLTPFCLNPGYG